MYKAAAIIISVEVVFIFNKPERPSLGTVLQIFRLQLQIFRQQFFPH